MPIVGSVYDIYMLIFYAYWNNAYLYLSIYVIKYIYLTIDLQHFWWYHSIWNVLLFGDTQTIISYDLVWMSLSFKCLYSVALASQLSACY